MNACLFSVPYSLSHLRIHIHITPYSMYTCILYTYIHSFKFRFIPENEQNKMKKYKKLSPYPSIHLKDIPRTLERINSKSIQKFCILW